MRRLLLLALAMIFFDVAFYAAIAPLLPDYVAQFGLSRAGAGILSAAYAAGTLLMSLPAGLIATRVGPRRTVIWGLMLLGVSSLVFGFGEDIVLLDGARFAQGMSGALIWSGALTWLITSPAGAPRLGDRHGTWYGGRRRPGRPAPGGGCRRGRHRTGLRRRAGGRGSARAPCLPSPRGSAP